MSLLSSQDRQLIEIYDAIMGNSPSLLQAVLETIDPAKVEPAVRFCWKDYEQLDDEDGTDYESRTDMKTFTFGAADEGRTTIVSLQHIAVYNCCKNKSYTSYNNQRDTTLQILDILLRYHLKFADNHNWSRPYHIGRDTIVFNTPGFYYTSYSNLYPKHFAAKLKALQDSITLGVCIDKIIQYEKDLKAKLEKKLLVTVPVIPMKKVPEPVFNTWESLLFSEKYADIIFEVTDQTVTPSTITNLYAHRCIITTSSQYFDAMLSGNWRESHGSNNQAIIKVNQNLAVYKCLLTYVYTGKIDNVIVSSHSLELLDLAAQCQYDVLTSLCELEAVKIITVCNVVSLLLSSNRYDLKNLKSSCLKFIKSNASLLMFDSKLMELSTSHKKLFNEIKKELGQTVIEEKEEEEEEEEEEEDDDDDDNSKENEKTNIEVGTQKSTRIKRSSADSNNDLEPTKRISL